MGRHRREDRRERQEREVGEGGREKKICHRHHHDALPPINESPTIQQQQQQHLVSPAKVSFRDSVDGQISHGDVEEKEDRVVRGRERLKIRGAGWKCGGTTVDIGGEEENGSWIPERGNEGGPAAKVSCCSTGSLN
ncbi:hypothetical protein Syun_020168 [Stephania yunnanensis]|uniref:Uncharacterized protein n=1 Tax=Stephania yunnanensis TaxID=152371 RepID=A0AAP0IEL6_9MAGN